MRRAFALGMLVALAGSAAQEASPCDEPTLLGRWVGKASAPGEETAVVLDVSRRESGLAAALSLPDVGVAGWPATSITTLDCGLRLEFPSDSGPQAMSLRLDGQALRGEWRDNRFEEPAAIVLAASVERAAREERGSIDGPAGRLGISILLPEGPGPFPGVVFLHGSGPQPRDASRFAARALVDLGVAAAIFDKRGVAESEGELAGASFEDLADDGIAVARHLLERPEVSRVGFFGHSQGGWIGPLAASRWKDAAFVISSAGPAVPPAREAQWTSVRALREAGAGEAAVAGARRVIELFHEGIRSGEWSAFDAVLAEARQQPWYPNAGLEWSANRPDAAFARSYAAYMDYDPLPALRALRAPMLAILSPDDESIDAVETEGILRGLMNEGVAVRVRLYPGYDHAMRRLGTDGEPLRWPEHPDDYFATQADFIERTVSQR